MTHWADNIPPQVVLCKDNEGNFHKVISKSKDGVRTSKRFVFHPDNLTPLTPQEVWELMPWNYDMDSAPKDGTEILLKNDKGYVEKCLFYGDWCYGENYTDFYNPIAWLPLPEQFS